MEKNLTVFENEEFGNVRVIELDGEIWFVGKDVATALGQKNPERAIRKFVDDEDQMVTELVTISGSKPHAIINESGLYSIILNSKTEKAKRFKRWVTSEVLPSIRKNGFYATENFLNNSDQLIDSAPEILIKIANAMENCPEKNKRLRKKKPIADPKIPLTPHSMQKRLEMQEAKIKELQAEIQKLKEDFQILLPF